MSANGHERKDHDRNGMDDEEDVNERREIEKRKAQMAEMLRLSEAAFLDF